MSERKGGGREGLNEKEMWKGGGIGGKFLKKIIRKKDI